MARRKGSAPFSKMTKDLAEFVNLDAGYLPDKPSLKIKDLSHMLKDNSAVALSQQSKAGEPLLNVEPTANISTPIASSFSQTEHNHGLIDDSSSESSSDSNESEDTVELWKCPNQHGATVEGQVKFLCSLGNRNKYLGLINALHLTQVRMGSVEDALPGGLDWKYDNFHLPPEGHKWSPKHKLAFGSDLFTMTGKVHGRAHLVTQALFTGMLIRDTKMVVGGRTPLCGYPFIPPELKGKTIPGHYISGYILPCPADVKGKWHEACDFMLGLSSDKQYRQLVMSLEQIDNSRSPDQDCARRIPLLDFSWDTNSHHARDVPHKSWAMAFKAITSVTLHDSVGERYGRWYITLHATFVGMILCDIAMSKLTLAMCTYPSLTSFVASTCITDLCVADAIQWCKTLRHTILKGSQHKQTAQKRPKLLADLPAAKKPRQDAAQEPVIAARPTRIQKPKKMDPSDYLINKTGHGLQNS
ncbi:hypothetical protein PAXRUDRAFT_17068 [Paxillus rubicundulus Ve08.2h10]|uniref:Uncharacterized protein n=1 Tax=Paxillus rubicundulus Ve08.2h10 TaxID=930991 RepID=A0A0D0C4N9_9AGAM|nr:hypothetical protein PAXRUDRAFT_17068 [Paxillus rubicundulus Ve08.2h10]